MMVKNWKSSASKSLNLRTYLYPSRISTCKIAGVARRMYTFPRGDYLNIGVHKILIGGIPLG
jgi:hypothetical protein